MNILQIMGCTSDQYASMERYLVEKAKISNKSGNEFYVVYENIPTDKQFSEDFIQNGGKMFQLKQKNFYDFRYYKKILKIIKEKKIDVVHTYFTPTCHYVNIFLTLRGLKKLVRTGANLPLSRCDNGENKSAFYVMFISARHKILSLFVRKILCRSEGVLKAYQKIGISPGKLSVTSGGIDDNFYRFSSKHRLEVRRRYILGPKTFVLGIFCRLTPRKRINILIRMLSEWNSLNKKIKLVIAGDGPESENLRRLAQNLELNDKVAFLGAISDVSHLYSAIDVFCLPSLSEGMSNSILEAMASELPVIASDIPPNRELIDEGKGGYLISFKDAKRFHFLIEKLHDERIRKKMGEYNRTKVISQLNLKSRIEKELLIYNELFS